MIGAHSSWERARGLSENAELLRPRENWVVCLSGVAGGNKRRPVKDVYEKNDKDVWGSWRWQDPYLSCYSECLVLLFLGIHGT